jgi:hypothetical protein
MTFSDIHLEDVTTDSDGDEHRETVFKGQWLICGLGKKLPATVRIREKLERQGVAKRLFGDRANEKSDIVTDNAAFNQQFQIQTDDPHTAFYVLTPHFMEFIVAADMQAHARTYLCFSDDSVQIAIHNGYDSFEIGKNSAEIKDIPVLRQRIQREIGYITSILDELFKNEYLFPKRDQ